jgi:hypothetical protein
LKPWSTSEVAYLIEHAGTEPKRDICKHLRRSSKSVECEVYRLRKSGTVIDLRFHPSRLRTCPSCGCLRLKLGSMGICEPCRRRTQLATIHARIAALLPMLPPNERSTYDDTEAETESRADPMPKPPDTSGMSKYRASVAMEAHEIAMEDWAAGNLRREIKAAQKRKERIEKKAKSTRVL